MRIIYYLLLPVISLTYLPVPLVSSYISSFVDLCLGLQLYSYCCSKLAFLPNVSPYIYVVSPSLTSTLTSVTPSPTAKPGTGSTNAFPWVYIAAIIPLLLAIAGIVIAIIVGIIIWKRYRTVSLSRVECTVYRQLYNEQEITSGNNPSYCKVPV